MKRTPFRIGLLQLLASLLFSFSAEAQTPTHSTTLEREAKIQLDPDKLPEHVAIIMDGNGRWAARQGKPRVFGHQNAIQSVRDVVEGCAELSIPYLTLYAFSTENWERPQAEVDYLMYLISATVDNELEELIQKGVRIHFIGDLVRLPPKCQASIQKAQQASQHNQGLQLTIALSYSGRWDLLEATKAIAQAVKDGNLAPQAINEALLEQYLSTPSIPDPELLIRTSGEIRLSNAFLWQMAYTELFFTPVLWPDFRKLHLHEALWNYQQRERRFGKLGK